MRKQLSSFSGKGEKILWAMKSKEPKLKAIPLFHIAQFAEYNLMKKFCQIDGLDVIHAMEYCKSNQEPNMN